MQELAELEVGRDEGPRDTQADALLVQGVELPLEILGLAVEKNPEYGWAQMSLAIALNVTGDHDGSLSAARRAPTLSASDPYVLAFSGIFQAFAGEVDAGIPLARSAIRLDPLSVRTPFRNVAGVILFHAGRFEEARQVLSENVRLGGPDGPHMVCYRAATLARLGRTFKVAFKVGLVRRFDALYCVDHLNRRTLGVRGVVHGE